MNGLSLGIMELLGKSLGVEGDYFKNFFKDNDSIMRLNFYPPCQKPHLTLGTGPHCDPTSLTILHQDQVGGLQVFVDNQWRLIAPNFDAFVVNIGDTFMVIKQTPPHQNTHLFLFPFLFFNFFFSFPLFTPQLTFFLITTLIPHHSKKIKTPIYK